MHLQITICNPYLQAIRPCFQNNWVKVSLNFMEYFCGLCVCVIRLCMCILVSMCTCCAHEKAAGGLQVLCSISLCLFPRDRVSHWPRLEVSAPRFSSVCPLKYWGYIGMAAPNVRKKFNYYYFGWGQLCTRQLVLSFHLSMGYEDWAGCYTKCLYLCLHGYWESELGGLPPWVLLPAFPAPQIHSGGTLGQIQVSIYYLSYLSFQVS